MRVFTKPTFIFIYAFVLVAASTVFAQEDTGADNSAEDQADAVGQDVVSPAGNTTENFTLGGLLHGAEGVAKGAYDFAKHGVEDAESVGKEVGDNISEAAKKGLQDIKGLLNPCATCKKALSAGIESFTCSQTANALVGQTEKCTASVSEEAPEFAEYAEPICIGVRSGIKLACKKMLHTENIHKAEDKIVSSSCHHVDLCK